MLAAVKAEPCGFYVTSLRPVEKVARSDFVLETLAGAEGFEPSALGFGDRCSDQTELRPYAPTEFYPTPSGPTARIESDGRGRPACADRRRRPRRLRAPLRRPQAVSRGPVADDLPRRPRGLRG